MGKVYLSVVLCLAVVSFSTIEADRTRRPPRLTWGFKNGIPIRDYHAAQMVGPDFASDCYANPQKYGVNTFWYPQPLDHFGGGGNETWQQQVQWKNTSFKPNVSGDIVFLLLGGEGPIPTTWMCSMNYTWTKLAAQNNAFMVQVEHRYFGASWPKPNMSVPNLQWLTTEQALADLNSFIPAMNAKFKFNKPKWVIFGGSYPGTIAALLRVVYPNISNGNIASSAPLWAKVDFWEYAEKVGEAVMWESQVNASVNGNCYSESKAAFSQLRQMTYTDAGRAELNSVFQIAPPLGANMSNLDAEVTYFLANIYFTFEGIIQYSFDDRSEVSINRTYGLNVGNLCRYMVDTRYNYTQRVFNVYAWEAAWYGGSPYPFDNDYWGDMAYFRNVSFQAPEAAYRGWTWLTCNEFGWFQTTDNGNGLFGNYIPLSFFFQYCADMFDSTLTSDYIQNQVSATLGRYGLPTLYNGSNVVLPNGSLDPWGKLGCNVSSNATHRFVRTTVGGGHCVDMYPYTPGSNDTIEPADVANTIQLVTNQVSWYLTQPGPFGCKNQGDVCTKSSDCCGNFICLNAKCS